MGNIGTLGSYNVPRERFHFAYCSKGLVVHQRVNCPSLRHPNALLAADFLSWVCRPLGLEFTCGEVEEGLEKVGTHCAGDWDVAVGLGRQ